MKVLWPTSPTKLWVRTSTLAHGNHGIGQAATGNALRVDPHPPEASAYVPPSASGRQWWDVLVEGQEERFQEIPASCTHTHHTPSI